MDEDIYKEVNQLEKAEPVVQGLTDSMTFYKAITEKLSKDSYCFIEKRKLEDDEPFDIVEVPSNKLEPGMVAFVSVSKKANQ